MGAVETSEPRAEGSRRGRLAGLWGFGAVEAVLVLLVFALCVDVFAAVVLRYVFHRSLGFYDELARFLFVWMSFLGAATGVKRHGHFGVTFVVERLSPAMRRALAVFSTLAMLLFAGLLVAKGLTMVRLTASQLSPAMEIPISYLYAPVPIAGLLMIVYLLPHLARQLRGRA